MEILAKRLKWLREENRFGQKEVASNIGMTMSGYQKIEYGEREPKLEKLVKLADLFGVTTDFLLGRNSNNEDLTEIKNNMAFYQGQINFLKDEFSRLSHMLHNPPYGIPRDQNALELHSAAQSRMEIEKKMAEAIKNYNNQVLEYIIIASKLPFIDGSHDDVISTFKPYRVDVQATLFNTYSLTISGKDIGFIGHHGDLDNEEVAVIAQEEFLK
ncbi:helix-turn-helix domain-containing protein, partial [Cytobacillus praedii]|uniref:helix-turn-helix domain-containing protein n=1 Tax=Cytobacillus praedii TaxID=1742358 RepID=UPI0013F3CC6D